ncbi:MAG: hypothetical protein K2Z80_29520 [Xanthobacteraceae bacterium]|jgi:hypothetical protein|nr:hypothetical protein [Xanthobacteraceae bacterium]
MTRITVIRPQFVEFVPDLLEAGVLYISRRYATAAHLCCCGCGIEVVTPLNPAKWRLTESNGRVSLSPSVGNWSQPCQSHYWITGNQVKWAGAMSAEMIAAVKRRDRSDAERLTLAPPNWWTRLWLFIKSLFVGTKD